MNRNDLALFMRAQNWAVQASVSSENAPQAAAIGVGVTDALELVFETYTDSRKAKNLRANPRIALVIGWDGGETVQYEGLADEPSGEALASLKQVYFAKFPDGREREGDPRITYFRVRPTWLKYTTFTKGSEPEVLVFDADWLAKTT